jgi:hypothetical protein
MVIGANGLVAIVLRRARHVKGLAGKGQRLGGAPGSGAKREGIFLC